MMQSVTDAILQTIQQHAEWAWAIVFLIAFLESMAIIGLFMPGWVLLVGVGTMIGADILEFSPIVVSAYLGAVIGEYISFHLGYHYHEQITRWPIVAKREHLLQQSKEMFEKYGAYGVFIGRFIGPARAVIPLIAGISQMPKRTFMWVNFTSGILWAPLYLIPGILVGAAVDLDKEDSLGLLFIILVLAAIAWGAVRQVKRTVLTLQEKERRNRYYALLNSGLIIAVFTVCLVITVRSSYYDFFLEILSVINQRLF
jgi:membrane protein DedA with SNARE-associated domain